MARNLVKAWPFLALRTGKVKDESHHQTPHSPLMYHRSPRSLLHGHKGPHLGHYWIGTFVGPFGRNSDLTQSCSHNLGSSNTRDSTIQIKPSIIWDLLCGTAIGFNCSTLTLTCSTVSLSIVIPSLKWKVCSIFESSYTSHEEFPLVMERNKNQTRI